MEQNFERMPGQEWRMHDLKCLTSQISEHESLLRLKRRWLMDLPLSVLEQKRIEDILPPDEKMLPESLLREDDVSYEKVRTCIEKGFGIHNHGNEVHCVHKEMHMYDSHDSIRNVFFLLDYMSNKGLCSLIEILTGGMVKFEKTNSCMKRIIRGLLQKVISVKSDIPEKKLEQLFQLLKDKKNFHGNQMACSTASETYHASAIKVLDGLDDFPFRTLHAMHRKLTGVKGYVPSMQPRRNGMGRDKLTKLVRKYTLKMLSDLGEVDEPSERLAGALGVAGLTLKLIMNLPAVREFRKFSLEIEALQNDIAKAIHLLNDTKKVSLIELTKVQQLLDPTFQLSVRSIRIAIRNFLTEYLFECSDMDEVPDCILQTLDIINRRSQCPSRKKSLNPEVSSSPSPGEVMKEVIQDEVECVLTISAQAKEVVLNELPRHEFAEDFAHAYMEDYEESDVLCISDDDEQVCDIFHHDEFHSYGTYDQTESIGEMNPGELNSSISTNETDVCSFSPEAMSTPHPNCLHISEADSCKKSKAPEDKDPHDLKTEQNLPYRSRTPDSNSNQNEVKCEETTSSKSACSDFLVEEANLISQQSKSGNPYLEVQEACDITSMITYRFVGHALDKLAEFEGLELYQGDRLYLRSHSSISEDSEGSLDTLLTSDLPEIWRSVLQQ